MREKRISSRDNTVFRDLLSALEPKGIRKLGLFVLSGRKHVAEFVTDAPESVAYVVATPEMELPFTTEPPRLRDRAPKSLPDLLILERPLFNELDVFGTKAPLAIGRVPEIPAWNAARPPEGLEVFCALGEPSNVGALLRSAAAFGASRLILLQESATPFHPKALRAAAGTALKTPLLRGPSIRELETESLFALDMKGEPLGRFDWPEHARLLLGQEGPGVPELPRLRRLRIEMDPNVESLNATVAASLALYSYRLKFPLK